ncbi:hypothetical protein CEXT_765571 [Caerostris extrusa]|uniref:Uncharacterized protein n=1 Tax=Caerostris extrusa TaxID=172846 RepID=A0AAV4XY24_CAEEX|nr:hypothetical protein CEXT_765571 [Caerostris extrusa]
MLFDNTQPSKAYRYEGSDPGGISLQAFYDTAPYYRVLSSPFHRSSPLGGKGVSSAISLTKGERGERKRTGWKHPSTLSLLLYIT